MDNNLERKNSEPVSDGEKDDLFADILTTTNQPKRKTIFLFPNLLTSAALLCGFLAIVKATQSQFYTAGLLIFAAGIFDSLDGRVARFLNASSRFGEEYDSLSDVISFGAAPAVIVYIWALNEFGRGGTVVCAIYCVCAALRLARFNVNVGVVNKRFFQGLPSPAAAMVIASMILMIESDTLIKAYFPIEFIAFIVLFMGILMVSNISYYSFKEVTPIRSVPFKIMLFIVVLASLIYLLPEKTFFIFLFGYALFGFMFWLWRFFRSGKLKSFIRN